LGCGKIFEVPLLNASFIPETASDNIKDFTVVNSLCWYYGYCKNCKERVEEKFSEHLFKKKRDKI